MRVEIWKTIWNFPRYQVSSLGRVRVEKSKRLLKPRLITRGYFQVTLYRGGEKYGKAISSRSAPL